MAQPLRRAAPLPEPSDAQVMEGAWWLTRWISGSMHDPDWDDSWTSMSPERAMEVVAEVVGNKQALRRQALWRYLRLPEELVDQVLASKLLPPHDFAFQSFSGCRAVAQEEGPQIAGAPQSGTVGVLVSAKPAAERVAFGMADLKCSANVHIRDALLRLGDWQHQDEVLVRVREPLDLLTVEVLEGSYQDGPAIRGRGPAAKPADLADNASRVRER